MLTDRSVGGLGLLSSCCACCFAAAAPFSAKATFACSAAFSFRAACSCASLAFICQTPHILHVLSAVFRSVLSFAKAAAGRSLLEVMIGQA